MQSIRGIVSAVQEGRFRLFAENGRVVPFVLSHKAAAEPEDLPQLQRSGARVRVEYRDGGHLLAAVAHRIEVEE